MNEQRDNTCTVCNNVCVGRFCKRSCEEEFIRTMDEIRDQDIAEHKAIRGKATTYDDAYKEGYDCRYHMMPWQHNPYVEGTVMHRGFQAGHQQAHTVCSL